MRGIRLECQFNVRVVEQRVLKSFRNNQEAAGIASFNQCLTLLNRDRLSSDEVGQIILTERSGNKSADQRIVKIGDQQGSHWATIVIAVDHGGNQAADHDRNPQPDQKSDAILSPARNIFLKGSDDKAHGYSRNSLPVNNRKSVSRFGLRRLVSFTAPPLSATASKIAGKCSEAADKVIVRLLSSSLRTSS